MSTEESKVVLLNPEKKEIAPELNEAGNHPCSEVIASNKTFVPPPTKLQKLINVFVPTPLEKIQGVEAVECGKALAKLRVESLQLACETKGKELKKRLECFLTKKNMSHDKELVQFGVDLINKFHADMQAQQSVFLSIIKDKKKSREEYKDLPEIVENLDIQISEDITRHFSLMQELKNEVQSLLSKRTSCLQGGTE